MIEVSVINESPYELPEYQTLASAGVDLKAVLDEALKLKPLERKIIRTGLKIALPDGYEAQVRPRSGLAAKHGISILNAPGTIDADYRGEIGIILVNLSNQDFIVGQSQIVQVLSQDEVINKIHIKVLNPDLTAPELEDNSSILLKIDVPNKTPLSLLQEDPNMKKIVQES